jgi:hypothetical protein
MEDNTERKPGERFFIVLLLALSLFVLITAWFMPRHTLSDSGAFPLFIGFIMTLSVLRIFWKQRKIFGSWKWSQERSLIQPYVFPKDVTVYMLVLLVYILVTGYMGFWVSSYLFLICSFLLLKGAGPVRALITGAVMLAVIWLLFQYIFRIILW